MPGEAGVLSGADAVLFAEMREGHIVIERAGDPDDVVPVIEGLLKIPDGFLVGGRVAVQAEYFEGDGAAKLVSEVKTQPGPGLHIGDFIEKGGRIRGADGVGHFRRLAAIFFESVCELKGS